MAITDQVVLQLANLPFIQANDDQISQITQRILQLVGEDEYLDAEDKKQVLLIRQVWPIAQYIDTP